MFLRMINRAARDYDSGRTQGVFQAAFDLLDTRMLGAEEEDALRNVLTWFDKHLPGRRRFRHDLPPHAVFWFKATHVEVTRQAWALVNILRNQALPVEMLKTDRPGRIGYEDEMQIAAVPWGVTPS